jgi:hypothetical protein
VKVCDKCQRVGNIGRRNEMPTLFKDCAEFVKVCDKYQRVGNIGRRNKMPMNYSLPS